MRLQHTGNLKVFNDTDVMVRVASGDANDDGHDNKLGVDLS